MNVASVAGMAALYFFMNFRKLYFRFSIIVKIRIANAIDQGKVAMLNVEHNHPFTRILFEPFGPPSRSQSCRCWPGVRATRPREPSPFAGLLILATGSRPFGFGRGYGGSETRPV